MSLLSVNKKGKWVVGGIVAFALIATASTGLAAWVIGQTTNGEGSADITFTDEIKDASVSITMDEDADLSVNFGPSGAGALINASGESEEDLDFTVAGSVEFDDKVVSVASVTVQAGDIPEAYKEYIALPEEFVLNEETGYYEHVINVSEGKFEETLSFRWGEKTEGLNPCAYFEADEYEEGMAYLEVLTKLNNLEFEFIVVPNVTSLSSTN